MGTSSYRHRAQATLARRSVTKRWRNGVYFRLQFFTLEHPCYDKGAAGLESGESGVRRAVSIEKIKPRSFFIQFQDQEQYLLRNTRKSYIMDERQPLLESQPTNETNIQSNGKHNIVEFDPAGDPDNPMDWPTKFRWSIVLLLAFMAFTV